MPDIVLHAGMHKTGSTAIQVALFHSKAVFASHGVYYPLTGVFDGAHHLLARELRTGGPSSLFSQLREEISGKKELIVLSSEDFDCLGESQIAMLRRELEPVATSIRVLLYIRPQYGLIRSQYSQQIREAYIRDSFDAFFREALRHARFLRLLEMCSAWASVFGEALTVRSSIRRHLVSGSSLLDFVDFLGLAAQLAPLFADVRSANEGLTMVQCDVLRELARTERFWRLSFPERRSVFVRLNKSCASLRQLSDFKDAPDYRGLQLCRNHFQSDNEAIANRYFGGDNLFDKWYEESMLASPDGVGATTISPMQIHWPEIFRAFISELEAEGAPAVRGCVVSSET